MKLTFNVFYAENQSTTSAISENERNDPTVNINPFPYFQCIEKLLNKTVVWWEKQLAFQEFIPSSSYEKVGRKKTEMECIESEMHWIFWKQTSITPSICFCIAFWTKTLCVVYNAHHTSVFEPKLLRFRSQCWNPKVQITLFHYFPDKLLL